MSDEQLNVVASCDVDGAGLRVVDNVETPVDRSEVLRYLGYPSWVQPSRRISRALDHWIAEALDRAEPRAVYSVFPIAEVGKRQLRLKTSQGIVEFNGAIGEFLGMSKRMAVFIATAGPNVERLASQLLKEGDDLAGAVVNAVGAERAEAAEAVVIDQLRRQAAELGMAPTLPYSPGYCGMALKEQTKLFGLMGHQTVGVTLTPECLMRPLKSVSGLIGLGPTAEVEQFGSPCKRCEMKNCNMRR